MVRCFREGCSKRGAKRCSGCMMAVYCARPCQKACWPVHKYECNYRSKRDEEEEEDESEEEEEEEEEMPRPKETECTACGVRWSVLNPRDQICKDCGYTTCYECACHRQKGSCYCENSNFGWRYCEREPRPYHLGSRSKKPYEGDYHPGDKDTKYGPSVRPDLYENRPRRCTVCGERRLCLKRGAAQWYKDTYHEETTADREKRQPKVESLFYAMQDLEKRVEAQAEWERKRAAREQPPPGEGGCVIV